MLNGLLIDQWSIVGVVAEEEEEEVQLVIPNFAINCCSLTCSSSVGVGWWLYSTHLLALIPNNPWRTVGVHFLASFLPSWLSGCVLCIPLTVVTDHRQRSSQ